MIKQVILPMLMLAAGFPAVAVAGSEDAIVADPAHYSVEFENDRVRVIRIKYGPGEKSVMHTHGPNVSVMLSTGTVRMHMPDGTVEDMPAQTGDTGWSDSDEHLPENLSEEPMEVVLVELKD